MPKDKIIKLIYKIPVNNLFFMLPYYFVGAILAYLFTITSCQHPDKIPIFKII